MSAGTSINMSKGREVLFLIAIFLVNTILMTDFVVFTVTDVYYALWPEDTGAVNFILSGPYAFILLGGLIAPLLMKRINKKVLLVIVCGVFAVTSLFGCAVVSIPYMIVCRSLGGLCSGLAFPLQMGIIADVYIDEEKRAKVIGWTNAAMQLIGAVMSYTAGMLASNFWQDAYYTYILAAVMFVFVVLFIPKVKDAYASVKEKGVAEASEETVDDAPVNPRYKIRFVVMMINMMLACVVFSIPFLNFIAVFVSEWSLGDAQFAGMLLSVNTLSALVCCLLFGNLYNKLKSYTNILLYSGLAIALVLEAFFPSFATAIIAEALGGASFACAYTYTTTESSVIMPRKNVDLAFSLITVFNGIAGFGYNYIATWLMGLLGTELVTPQYGIYVVVGIVMVVLEAVSVIWYLKGKNKSVAESA